MNILTALHFPKSFVNYVHRRETTIMEMKIQGIALGIFNTIFDFFYCLFVGDPVHLSKSLLDERQNNGPTIIDQTKHKSVGTCSNQGRTFLTLHKKIISIQIPNGKKWDSLCWGPNNQSLKNRYVILKESPSGDYYLFLTSPDAKGISDKKGHVYVIQPQSDASYYFKHQFYQKFVHLNF